MVEDNTITFELDYSDGFREGFIQGYMAAHFCDDGDGHNGPAPCEHPECPRK
jgi:hypothetical protein